MADGARQDRDPTGHTPVDPPDAVGCALAVLFGSLTPSERAAFIVHDLMGLSVAETAALLHRSAPATELMAERARGRLRALAPSLLERRRGL